MCNSHVYFYEASSALSFVFLCVRVYTAHFYLCMDIKEPTSHKGNTKILFCFHPKVAA